MIWRKGLCASLLIVFSLVVLVPTTSTHAFNPYSTLYVGHLMVGAGTPYEFPYTYHDEITHHAFTFDAAAGDVLTLAIEWISDPPVKGHPDNGEFWQPELAITEGVPSVGQGEVFVWDWEADFDNGNLLPKEINNRGETLNDWEVLNSGTYTLYAGFYPYEESSGGTYSVSISLGTAALPTPAPLDGWTGEFLQVEGGDHFINGTIDGNPSWAVHSFPADPGDMLSIMVWNQSDTSADRLSPRLVLCEGGCDPANADILVSNNGDEEIAVVNYQMPGTVPPGTLHTVLVEGGTTTGSYSLWMRQWHPEDLVDQVAGGWMGELAMTEDGNLKMEGILASSDAFKVHSFRANPGDSVTVMVRAKRDTPADDLIPIVLLVPGGYEPGEQWLVMAVAEDEAAAQLTVTIPGVMPPDTLYTVVIADTANTGQLMFGDPAVTGYAGGYRVVVTITPFN